MTRSSELVMEIIDPSKIEDYHAHIYYDVASRETAARIRESIEKNFAVEIGRWHDEPIGPHRNAMYQVKIVVAEFNRILPWLMLNRRGLNILVHPNTGDAFEDHATHALWLGDKLPLRLEVLRNLPKK